MSSKFIPNLSVTDGFDFVKKIWGSLPIPNVINSTTDLEELDKRIADLKAVEQWLNVNLSMLRATIQGLEVQRGTIATIKSFGANLAASGARGERSDLDEEALREAVNRMMGQVAVEPEVPKAEPVSPVVPKVPEPELKKDAPKKKPETTAADESSKALISNATAWWGLLQDQLNKVATAAISGAGLGVDEEVAKAAASQKAPPKPRGKAAASKATAAKPRKRSSTTATRKKSTGSRS
ncbi:MAG: PhaM family polyhydroxyalkanoate granule multifunctional regulatory protein [Limnobacter sp.]|nr:PhaM family polyhydroxyalkanoate granule multifunctional regulatory protein [Limnobacter sp.]